MSHPWLKDFPWKKLYDKEIEAPFIPNVIFLYIFYSRLKRTVIIKDKSLIVKMNRMLHKFNKIRYY